MAKKPASMERFDMRLIPEDRVLFERLDTWRRLQDDVPTRAEAVRRLLDRALAAAGIKA